VRALGIDVGVRRGLDLVLLGEGRQVLDTRPRVSMEEVCGLARDANPDVVAIDAPPAWAVSGRSRVTERELRWFGLQSFNTPSDQRMSAHPFYEWMTVGFRLFAALADRFPRYLGTGTVRGHAIEVFPHATAAMLAGCLAPEGIGKRTWRRAVLRDHGVDARGLRSLDQVDAALAALTGLFALEGRFIAPGDPREGQIVLPAAALPASPYRRGPRPPVEGAPGRDARRTSEAG
jgi:predicted nuclease with RNAse H fold